MSTKSDPLEFVYFADQSDFETENITIQTYDSNLKSSSNSEIYDDYKSDCCYCKIL